MTPQKLTPDQIANANGVDILPASNGQRALRVQDFYRRGFPLDDERIARVRRLLIEAGYAWAADLLA